MECAARPSRSEEERPAESMDSGDHETEHEGVYGLPAGDDDEFDFIGNLEAELTLQEHLCQLLRATVSAEDYLLGEYIINALDERGWLAEDPEGIACDTGRSVEEVLRVLHIIQSFDPPGVGAMNLQECLLLQLAYLREEDPTPAHLQLNLRATVMIRDRFDHVCARRYTKLSRAARLSVDEVKATLDYVRTRLNPFPASQFRPPWLTRPNAGKTTVRPDVIIQRTQYGFDIEVLGGELYSLSVSAHYRDIYTRLKNNPRQDNDEGRKQIIEYVERAERFIQNIQQRRLTLRQITQCIVDCQTGFMETGSPQFLRPLTRTQVARTLGIHESTVSRATSNKFVQLPNQEVIGFDVFFDSSLSVKKAIEELIQDEDPANPLSDQQIVDMLVERGIEVARRTIVKYRSSRKILSSTRRKQ